MEAYRNVSNGNCVEEWLLQHYVNGHLPQTEKDRIERHLSCCEYCSDEVEGMKLISEHKRKATVRKLEEKLYKKYIDGGKSRKLTAWVVAAACVAGILGTVVFYFNKPADIAMPIAQISQEKTTVDNKLLMENGNSGSNANFVADLPENTDEELQHINEIIPEEEVVVSQDLAEDGYVESETHDESDEMALAFELNSNEVSDSEDSLLLAFNDEPNFRENAGVTRGKKVVAEKTEFEIQMEKYMKDSSNCLLVQRLLDMAQMESNIPSITRFTAQLEYLHCNE